MDLPFTVQPCSKRGNSFHLSLRTLFLRHHDKVCDTAVSWGEASVGKEHLVFITGSCKEIKGYNIHRDDFIQNTEGRNVSVAVTLSHPSLGSWADRSSAQTSPRSCTSTRFSKCWVWGAFFRCASVEMLDHCSASPGLPILVKQGNIW